MDFIFTPGTLTQIPRKRNHRLCPKKIRSRFLRRKNRRSRASWFVRSVRICFATQWSSPAADQASAMSVSCCPEFTAANSAKCELLVSLTGVRAQLMASADRMCPMEGCGETGMSPDSLIPNKFLRTAVTNFLNETGYTKMGKSGVDTPPPPAVAPSSPDVPKNRGFYRPPRDDSPHVPTVILLNTLVYTEESEQTLAFHALCRTRSQQTCKGSLRKSSPRRCASDRVCCDTRRPARVATRQSCQTSSPQRSKRTNRPHSLPI